MPSASAYAAFSFAAKLEPNNTTAARNAGLVAPGEAKVEGVRKDDGASLHTVLLSALEALSKDMGVTVSPVSFARALSTVAEGSMATEVAKSPAASSLEAEGAAKSAVPKYVEDTPVRRPAEPSHPGARAMRPSRFASADAEPSASAASRDSAQSCRLLTTSELGRHGSAAAIDSAPLSAAGALEALASHFLELNRRGVPSSLDANPADVSSLPPALVGTSSQQARYPWALAALGAYLRASELSLDAGEAVSPMLLKGEAAARAALRQFGYPRTIDSFAGRALKAGVGWSKKQNDGAADDGGVTSPETREGGGAEAFRFGGSNQPKKAKGKENGGPRNAGAGASWWNGRKSANKNTPEKSGLSERGDDAIAEQEHTSKSGQMKFKF